MGDDRREVVVTDVQIPFWSMVALLVKLAIAAIPALFILTLLATLAAALLGWVSGGALHWWSWRWT